MDSTDTHTVANEDVPVPGSSLSLSESGDTGEGGKLKMIVQLVKKALGVKDIASMFVQLLWSRTLTCTDPGGV